MEEEFLHFLDGNAGIIHKICRIYFPGKPEERKDLYQEIVYQAWRSFPGFRREARFSTWLYKVGLNTAITHVRKEKRRPDGLMLTEDIPDIPDESGSLHHSEAFSQMMEAITTLSSIDKAIVSLYLDDYAYEEMAEIIGMTKTNISVRLVRIRTQLSQKINNTIK